MPATKQPFIYRLKKYKRLMDRVESYLSLKVKGRDSRLKIRKIMSMPDFFRYGETKSLYYVLSSEQFDKYYQVSISNNNKLKCSCRAVEFGSNLCVHKHITNIMLFLDK